MTKAEIVNQVAKSTGIERVAVQTVVESTMERIMKSIIDAETVYLRRFVSFIIMHRAHKPASHITQSTPKTIPAHDIPAFKPAKCFVDEVKNK